MKSARELFEELGYKEVNEFNNILHFEKDIGNERIFELNIIEFELNHEALCVCRKVGNKFTYGAFYFEDGLLQAINKQVEELGW